MRGKSDCGAGEEVAVNQSNGDGRGKLLELVVNQLALSIFFNLFRPLVSHSLMSFPNSRLSIQETMSSSMPSSLAPYLLQVCATISRKSKHKCIHDDKLQYHPMAHCSSAPEGYIHQNAKGGSSLRSRLQHCTMGRNFLWQRTARCSWVGLGRAVGIHNYIQFNF